MEDNGCRHIMSLLGYTVDTKEAIYRCVHCQYEAPYHDLDLFDDSKYELAASAPTKWEYRFQDYESTTSATSTDVMDLFEYLGNDGWELVSNELVEAKRWRRKYRAILKRYSSANL